MDKKLGDKIVAARPYKWGPGKYDIEYVPIISDFAHILTAMVETGKILNEKYGKNPNGESLISRFGAMLHNMQIVTREGGLEQAGR